MNRTLITLALSCAALTAHAWGPGDDAGGEPPGPNPTFEQGAQQRCVTMHGNPFLWDFVPALRCGYVPPVKPPTEWVPPIVVPTPPVPEPSTWLSMLAGLAALIVLYLWRTRR